MSSRRFDGIKYEGFDRLGEAELRSIYDHLGSRVDDLIAQRDELAGHMAVNGYMTALEAFGDVDLPVYGNDLPQARLADPEMD